MSERLIGGPSSGTRRKLARDNHDAAPPRVGMRFIALVFGVAALFAAAGAWHVSLVFAMRDQEMEASRLQALLARRRDAHKTLVARLSTLHRDEILRAAAVQSLGMAEPDPAQIGSLEISAESVARWRAVAGAAPIPTGKEDQTTILAEGP